MRRLLVFLVVAVGVFLAVRKMAESMGPAMREHCAEMCDRMLAGMPESFPPNRMMADLDTLKERADRMLAMLQGSRP
ncbi:MAG: hypothetical protein IH941_02945 [Acidobacteria bacterium]|nr:hypothetical protein [Acidobacteriota bacterium]